jgi:sugar lactone lactonase YvrE
MGLAVDDTGNLYFADDNFSIIFKVTPDGMVTRLAGSGAPAWADGTGANASFYYPMGVAVDSQGNVYVADYMNHRIRKVSPFGVVTTLAGSGAPAWADGTGTNASFNNPFGVALDSQGNLYVADQGNNRIRMVTPDGVVTTLAGSGYIDYTDDSNAVNNGTAKSNYFDGKGANASFANPTGVAVDAQGNVYVADNINNVIRKVTSGGVVTTLAGSGYFGHDNGVGKNASFGNPVGVAVDTHGNVYVTDSNNGLIRKVTQNGIVTTLAGSIRGDSCDPLDGTGTSATFCTPYGITIDSTGNLYVADGQSIRKIT